MANKVESIPASAAKHYQITKNELPLSCPMPNMTLWSAHPKVYLAIEKTGKVSCPYCSASYELLEEASD